MPLLLFIAIIAAPLGWSIWRRTVRRRLARAVPSSFVLPHDPSWAMSAGAARDRTLALRSAVNLRDVGGYPAVGGQRVKWGMVYRSGALHDLSDEDAAALAKQGIKVVCDFRSALEVEAAPDDAARFGARYETMALDADHSSMRRLHTAMFRPARLRDLMRESYNEIMVERNAPLVGRFLRLVADADNLPVLFHCTAGKDRTGLAAMILLALLGVPDDVIAADYSLSNQFYETFRVYVGAAVKKLRWIGMNVDDLHPLLIADPALILEALAGIRDRYGTVEAYVEGRCGVDAAVIANIRALLLEDTD